MEEKRGMNKVSARGKFERLKARVWETERSEAIQGRSRGTS